MDITGSAYQRATDETLVEVEIFEVLSDFVSRRQAIYRVTLSGQYEHGTEAMYEAVAARLEDAGVQVMPF